MRTEADRGSYPHKRSAGLDLLRDTDAFVHRGDVEPLDPWLDACTRPRASGEEECEADTEGTIEAHFGVEKARQARPERSAFYRLPRGRLALLDY